MPMSSESTVEEVIATYERFRVLCVGRSGVGKSSLINKVFGITEAKVSKNTPGDADINTEFTSPENNFFVLHDSIGFEPGDEEAFNKVINFISDRTQRAELKDRLHAIWLCTKTPTGGARLFERGDKKILKHAYDNKVPVIVVFTQYDKSERMKIKTLEKNPLTKLTAHERGKNDAEKEFERNAEILKADLAELCIPVPAFVRASAPPPTSTYSGNVLELVNATCDLLRPDGDQPDSAWLIWAIAQRVSLPLKVEACVDKGINYYHRALSGSIPLVGGILLRTCLDKVHRDIVTCWNFKDPNEFLDCDKFKEQIQSSIQDVYNLNSTAPPSVDKVSQFATFVASATSPAAGPILGLSLFFGKWLSDAILENNAEVNSVMMAYIVNLIYILKEFFQLTLIPRYVGEVDWNTLHVAFETYHTTDLFKRNSDACQSPSHMDRKRFRAKIEELVRDAKR